LGLGGGFTSQASCAGGSQRGEGTKRMYLTIIFLPLFGSIVAGLFGRYVGPKGATVVTTSCLFLALFLSFFAFYEAGLCGAPTHIKLFP
jgi:NADH-ubiquinone oxidoreductase chain 5